LESSHTPALAQLTRLTRLSTRNDQLLHGSIHALTALTLLRCLELAWNFFDGSRCDLGVLGALTALSRLSMTGNGLEQDWLGAAASSFLAKLTLLRSLDLSRNPVQFSGPELNQLTACTCLEELNLEGTTILVHGMAALGRLTSLQALSIAGASHAGPSSLSLCPLSNLQALTMLYLAAVRPLAAHHPSKPQPTQCNRRGRDETHPTPLGPHLPRLDRHHLEW
jgi:hypothetical protein